MGEISSTPLFNNTRTSVPPLSVSTNWSLGRGFILIHGLRGGVWGMGKVFKDFLCVEISYKGVAKTKE